MSIKIGIVGYGNLGKGAELAIEQNEDMELVAIFTRRDLYTLNNSKMVNISEIERYKGKIDVMILCGGSATDLPKQTPKIAKTFNTVDSFDNHVNIPQHFEKVDKIGKEFETLNLVSAGWDPGLFSIYKILSESILPVGNTYSFWGEGVSQGHSDAIRRIEDVIDAKQYTIPIESALNKVRSGKNPVLTTREKHLRKCYVVVEDKADKVAIELEIKNMPNYFDEYDTEVNFISQKELDENHAGMPHGGYVLRTGESKTGTKQRMEFVLELGSNPEFTSSVLVAYARAVKRISDNGQTGCLTVFDVPLAMLSPKSNATLRKELL
ncbi:MAG: diaminopimelate dehydrogenase [Methanobacteriaceae archaeon]|jgi:diaminopimelate dehydrogenase|nr:diaminopimelate dehydrogenase [Candidatus Methanorudis spinitermitis]